MHRPIRRIFIALLSSITIMLASSVYADPPSRVGRLSYIQGTVSFSPADAGKHVWVTARINRPLVAGDRIWAADNARAELQLGNAAFWFEDATSLRIINLNDHIAQVGISQGTLALHVRRLNPGQVYEIDTPNLAFRINQTGEYRIDVDDNGNGTIVTVYRGKGIAYAKNAAYKIKGPNSYRFIGQNLNIREHFASRRLDNFDRWTFARELRVTKSQSARYVSTSVIGYEDLDNYGSWRFVKDYGYVWAPNQVPAGWAPYRNGHWSWVNPWGWTWIDDQPWGFAPSHYGRWAYYRNTWVWVPGRKSAQSSYAPALVAFIGGKHSQLYLSIGNSNPGIAWFPLGPKDVYVPPYQVSKQYFTNINVTNTTVTQTQVTTVYNNPTAQGYYSNHQVPNAVTAVPTKVFVQSQPAAAAAVPVSNTTVTQTPVSTTATVTPQQSSLSGYSSDSNAAKPSESTLNRVPVVVTPPPPPAASFEEQQKKLAEDPGKPLDKKDIESLKPVDIIPVVTVAAPAEKVIPEAKPDTVKADDKAAADKAEADKADATAKADAEKEATGKAASTKVEADKAATENAEADKAAAAKANAEKEASEKADADKAAASAKANAEKETSEKADADKAAASAKAEADKAATENAEANKAAAAAKADAEKEAAEKADADKAASAAKAEAEKAAAEKAAADKAAADQAEVDKAAAAKADAEREAAEKAEADKAAAAAKAEAEKAANEKAEADRAAADAKADAEKQAAEKANAEQAAAAAKAEADKAASEKAEADRAAAAAKADAEKQAAEKASADQAVAKAKAEADKAASEKAAAEKAEADKAAATTPATVPTSEPTPPAQ